MTARRPRRPNCAHNGMVRPDRIRHGRAAAARVLVFCTVTLAVIAVAPVIVLVGEPLRRYYLRRLSPPPLPMRPAGALSRFGLRRGVLRRTARRGRPVTGQARVGLGDGRLPPRSSAGWRRRSLARVIANPVLIALTAPERWAIDQVGGLSSGGRGFGRFGRRGGNWPPPAGVREPRRPKPTAPAGATRSGGSTRCGSSSCPRPTACSRSRTPRARWCCAAPASGYPDTEGLSAGAVQARPPCRFVSGPDGCGAALAGEPAASRTVILC